MKDVSEKLDTSRHAIAKASLKTTTETIEMVNKGLVPKGNVLEMARAAGILAAKKTSDLIPFCHQIPLDWITVDFEILKQEIVINSQAKAIWKTGVEMEALTAATIAALTLYDMLKPLDSGILISNIKLIEKRGGKSDRKMHVEDTVRAAVVVLSDSVSQDKRKDKSGKLIIKRLKEEQIEVAHYEVLPDNFDEIKDALIRLSDEDTVNLILTTGGTGLGPKDVTVDATNEVIDKELPGISEAVRIHGFKRTPYSMLSQGQAGLRGNTMIINLPGSSKGVEESMSALFPWVLHSFHVIKGGGHDDK